MVVSFVKILQKWFLGVIFIYFGVTNFYKTLDNYCKRKLFKVSVVIAVKTRAFQFDPKF